MFDKDYFFRGKHADMVDTLKAKLSDDIGTGFFATIYDIYRVAPIVGWIYNRKALPEKSDNTTKIFNDKMRQGIDELMFNYRLLMILCNKDKSKEEIMNIAFRLDEKNEERKEYDELYNSYVLGGVEEIYERIFSEGKDTADYLMNAYEFIQDLNMRIYNIVPQNDLY